VSARLTRWLAAGLFGLVVGTVASPPPLAFAQELTRKAKTKIAPLYPELARRMAITGTVKVLVVVSPSGTVKSAKAVGGHPLLVDAAMDAVKKWRFEPAADDSTGVVEFKFQADH